jgi:methyl-accepting chemotaxis protein
MALTPAGKLKDKGERIFYNGLVNGKPKRGHKRTHYLINRPLQLRYMFFILILLLTVMGATVASMYYGIWGSVLRELSDEGIRNKLIIANRIYQYEKVRQNEPAPAAEAQPASLSFIRETELLSAREREVFKEILGRTNRRLMLYFAVLLGFIAWVTVFLSHKIAGPLYRFEQCFQQLEQGDLTVRARLRKHDEAIWLAEKFNRMAERLDHHVNELKRSAGKLEETGLSGSGAKEHLRNTLAGFKTTG